MKGAESNIFPWQLMSLGLGLLAAWRFCTFGLNTSFVFSISGFADHMAAPWAVFATAQVGFGVLSLFAAWVMKRRGTYSHVIGLRTVIAGVIIMLIGSLMLISGSTLFAVAGEIVIAAGTVIVLWALADICRVASLRSVSPVLPGSILVSSTVLVLLIGLDSQLRFIVSQMFLIISAALVVMMLHQVRHSCGHASEVPSPDSNTLSSSSRAGSIVYGIAFVAPAVIIFFLMPLVTSHTSGIAYQFTYTDILVGHAVALVASLLLYRLVRMLDPLAVLAALAPLLGLMALLSATEQFSSVASSVAVTSISLAPALTWICLVKYAQQGNGRSVLWYAANNILFQGGVLLGGVLAQWVTLAIEDGSIAFAPTALTVLFVLVAAESLVFIWMMRDKTTEPAEREPDQQTSPLDVDVAVEMLSERYSLSDREREVIGLLAHGRTAPYISETLFISLNTVNTHVKRIYRKVGVHTRQELLDAIEKETLAAKQQS